MEFKTYYNNLKKHNDDLFSNFCKYCPLFKHYAFCLINTFPKVFQIIPHSAQQLLQPAEGCSLPSARDNSCVHRDSASVPSVRVFCLMIFPPVQGLETFLTSTVPDEQVQGSSEKLTPSPEQKRNSQPTLWQGKVINLHHRRP